MTLGMAAKELGEWCDRQTGIEGSSGYVLLFVLTLIAYIWMNDGFQSNGGVTTDVGEEEGEPEPPRNFTAKQLRHFDGTKDEKTDEEKPVYLSVSGTVFDVSKGRDFYGPGPYEQFAGRECGVALATMSFDETLLDNVEACKELGVGDKAELDNWKEKFEHYRCYPIMGRLVPDAKLPPSDRVVAVEELSKFNGLSDEVPKGEYEGYARMPILVGALDKVFDCSFGGVPMYGKDGPYNKFAGKDVSRALALMSFDPKDIENADISDLEEKKITILKDWVNTFENKKGYPVVGKLVKKF
ncbi:hypothetical protein THAOC_10451 [Thalassiosira oceanica]|uniref:Cytochrome b5 heme-binding domain-containing protein n=1 Tax=Thalassiosira oceanica TaxID=159749 RepID=K0SPZ2_THAOC|nr:hypothetical protein THAOC_10451 [Thalassiosira oceanica]|eukprot:EJK68373.1 hypothetical protein THAOC_10451 [Thalassiosira oceanica]